VVDYFFLKKTNSWVTILIHAFTVDVEDWFQGIELSPDEWDNKEDRLARGLDVLLALLEEADVRATFFVLGWIVKKYPHVVKQLAEAGHEIGSHGLNHEKVYCLSPEEFRRDEFETKACLEDVTGKAVVSYRAPFFSITKKSLWALDILAALGYHYDCSISPVVTWRYGIAGAPEGIYRLEKSGLIEYTLSSWTLLGRQFASGGAYFRIFPPYLTCRPFRAKTKGQHPAMFYVHPWEYDPDHPVVDFEWKARLTHYYNLGAMAKRTKQLLARFRFGSVQSVIAKMDQKLIPTVSESVFDGCER
jgi:polysaccharide deacetylase family protein (PEP-CTERM system associated)